MSCTVESIENFGRLKQSARDEGVKQVDDYQTVTYDERLQDFKEFFHKSDEAGTEFLMKTVKDCLKNTENLREHFPTSCDAVVDAAEQHFGELPKALPNEVDRLPESEISKGR